MNCNLALFSNMYFNYLLLLKIWFKFSKKKTKNEQFNTAKELVHSADFIGNIDKKNYHTKLQKS